ncbi:MAG: ketoacyl-ACP synthase III [Halobacteriovoraceae bacterium]|nr:ketoacyl-ACP synthase III [Halobacteriovoraceae bacterium]
MTIKTKIISTGIGLPEKILSNYEIAQKVETSHEWIVERTGIHQRRISNPNGGEFPSDLALKATKMALEKANLVPDDIEMIILATTVPDYQMPNTSSNLQSKLGMTNKCGCIDISAACSGFLYGAVMAHSMIKSGMYKRILVVGSDMLSRIVNWEDRGTCILFGDGCGVAIIEASTDSNDSSEFLATKLSSDSSGFELLKIPHGGAINPTTSESLAQGLNLIHMQGKDTFKFATRTLSENARNVCEEAKVTPSDIDWLIPHQANRRIIETTAKLLNFPMEKVIVNIEKYGNTSAATVPLALHEAIEDKRIKRGDLILFTVFGAGLTSAAALIRY